MPQLKRYHASDSVSRGKVGLDNLFFMRYRLRCMDKIPPPRKRKNPFAVALARRRMVKMTPEQRSAVARAGALATNKLLAERRAAEAACDAAN